MTDDAIIMIISVIVIILIAKLADNRETQMGNKIIETEHANEVISNEIVALKDENYKLKKENEKYTGLEAEFLSYKDVNSAMAEVVTLIKSGDIDGAENKLISIDQNTLDETQKTYYEGLKMLLDKIK